jgi:hypothetical protein
VADRLLPLKTPDSKTPQLAGAAILKLVLGLPARRRQGLLSDVVRRQVSSLIEAI